eukprot:g17652.t1
MRLNTKQRRAWCCMVYQNKAEGIEIRDMRDGHKPLPISRDSEHQTLFFQIPSRHFVNQHTMAGHFLDVHVPISREPILHGKDT